MRGKLLFITGGLIGYVLGARAGRKRYDQIAAAATDLWNAPPVQRRVTEVRDAALELVGDVPGNIYQAGKKAVSQAVAKKRQGKPDPLPSTATAKPAAAKSPAAKPAAAKPAAAKPTRSAAKTKPAADGPASK